MIFGVRIHNVWYNIAVRFVWAASADKHGVDHDDALAAIASHVHVEWEFQGPRPPATIPPSLFIGQQRDPSKPPLEVIAAVDRSRQEIRVFHVMEARPKMLRRMR